MTNSKEKIFEYIEQLESDEQKLIEKLAKYTNNTKKEKNMDKEEIEKLIEDMTKVRPEMLNEEALKLFNTIMKIIDERDTLIQERDYYKARYNEFNDAFIEGGKKLTKGE